jgi:hypothetical protein
MLKKIVKKELNRRGYYVSPMIHPDRIKSFIQKLHPYQTDKKLIRVGANTDGGYLVPDDLNGIKACFSPGVAQVSEFEKYCLSIGMNVYMADKSVDKPNLDVSPERYDFIKKFIGSTNTSDFITMDEWVSSFQLEANEDLLLQMDIEGAEYYSLINISDSLMRRFRIIVIEFHYLEELWNPRFFSLAEEVFNKILKTHLCVHIHPNNDSGIHRQLGVEIPPTAEFTFLRKDRAQFKSFHTQFPHPLDRDNRDDKPFISLPKIWYVNT